MVGGWRALMQILKWLQGWDPICWDRILLCALVTKKRHTNCCFVWGNGALQWVSISFSNSWRVSKYELLALACFESTILTISRKIKAGMNQSWCLIVIDLALRQGWVLGICKICRSPYYQYAQVGESISTEPGDRGRISDWVQRHHVFAAMGVEFGFVHSGYLTTAR